MSDGDSVCEPCPNRIALEAAVRELRIAEQRAESGKQHALAEYDRRVAAEARADAEKRRADEAEANARRSEAHCRRAEDVARAVRAKNERLTAALRSPSADLLRELHEVYASAVPVTWTEKHAQMRAALKALADRLDGSFHDTESKEHG